MVLLVRRAEDAKLARALIAQQVQQVERALDGDLGAILDVVRHVEQLAQRRGVAARDAGIDPLEDRHVVEREAGRGEVVVRGRITRGGHVGVQRLPHLLHRIDGLGERLPRAVEVVEGLGAVLLGREQVVERESELLGQVPGFLVVLVDQLAAMLRDLPAVEGAADRPAAPAETGVALVHRGDHAGLAEPVRAGETREPRADDGHSRRGDRPEPAHDVR